MPIYDLSNVDLESFIRRIDRVFKDCDKYEVPDYRKDWMLKTKPAESWEELDVYLDNHHSPFDIDFPNDMGFWMSPTWADARTAASVCYTIAEHPKIDADDAYKHYFIRSAINGLKASDHLLTNYESLNDEQWQTFVVMLIYAVSPNGPMERWSKSTYSDFCLTCAKYTITEAIFARFAEGLGNQGIYELAWNSLYGLHRTYNEFQRACTHPSQRDIPVAWE